MEVRPSVAMLVAASSAATLVVAAAASSNNAALGHWGIAEVPGGALPVAMLMVFLAVGYLLYQSMGSLKSADALGGAQTAERLRVFAKWAQQQVEESKAMDHMQMLDDVIQTFSTYAQRMQKGNSAAVQRAAVHRLLVLIELLETPSVNHALRQVNWAWLREWDQGSLDHREARQRLTVVFPTICAAEKVSRIEARRPWARRRSAQHGERPHQETLAYLAGWCSDFLERPDAREFLGVGGGGVWPSTPNGAHTTTNLLAGALYSESSEDEEDSPVRGRRGRSMSDDYMEASVEASPQARVQEFGRKNFDGQEHCWDAPPATEAMVRGPNYLADRRKINSKRAMLELVQVDLFRTYDEINHYSKSPRGKVPGLRASGDDRFFFVVNFRLIPIQFCCIWAVPKDAEWLHGPEGVLFQRFLNMTDAERNARIKVLPKVLEGPWLVKKGVPDRPGVVGKKLALEYFKREDHLEVSINCISSPAGRRLVQLLTGAAKHFSMVIYIILEGQAQDELPERVLGNLGVYHGDLGIVPTK